MKAQTLTASQIVTMDTFFRFLDGNMTDWRRKKDSRLVRVLGKEIRNIGIKAVKFQFSAVSVQTRLHPWAGIAHPSDDCLRSCDTRTANFTLLFNDNKNGLDIELFVARDIRRINMKVFFEWKWEVEEIKFKPTTVHIALFKNIPRELKIGKVKVGWEERVSE